eukprot:m.203771 g.203771  ORF g.203771 m.203771 type:complete len:1062 (-) comp14997_c0_seq1:400-3585(-)
MPGCVALAVVTVLAVTVTLTHAYPSRVSCILTPGDFAMGNQVTSATGGTAGKCQISGLPAFYDRGQQYSFTVTTSISASERLAHASGGSIQGATSCGGKTRYSASSLKWNSPSTGDATVTISALCGKQNGVFHTSVDIPLNPDAPVICSSPPSVAHGTACSSSDSSVQSCDVTCDSGYELTSNTLACETSGSFTGSATCEAVTCTRDPTITHGTTCTTATFDAPSCEVTCDAGYEVDFNSLQCTASGSFSGAAACTAIACDTAPDVGNGTSCAGIVYGESCSVSCNDGFELTSNTLECQTDGSFTGEATCSNVDACENFSDACDVNAVGCEDVDGGPNSAEGITCGGCTTGYEGDGFTCTDIDGCAVDPCHSNATCTDVSAPGTGADCECNDRFFGDGLDCEACLECPAGSYATGTCTNSTDFDGCETCPGNSTSTVGAIGLDGCECNPGFEKNATETGFICEQTKCGAGQFLNESGVCEFCLAGCPAGSELNDGVCVGTTNTLECIPCGPGKFSSVDDAVFCSYCPPGRTPSEDALLCLLCPEGSVSTVGICTECTGNNVTDAAQRECVLCDDGEEAVDNAQCVSCSDNEFSTNGDACAVCSDGTRPSATQGTCEPCEGNTVGTGGLCSTQCGSGQEPNSARTACVSCATGFVSNGTLCVQCEDGTQPDATRATCQSCVLGTSGTNGVCEVCSDGTTNNTDNTACVSCGAQEFGIGGACTVCPDGKEPHSSKTRCVACSFGHAGTSGSCGECTGDTVPNADQTECVEQTLPECKSINDTAIACTPCAGCECPRGWAGSTTCLRCASGTVPSASGLNCSACDGNAFALNGQCVTCDDGLVPSSTSIGCTACTGRTIANTASGICVQCAGATLPNSNRTACVEAVEGSIYFDIDFSTIPDEAAFIQSVLDALEALGVNVDALLNVGIEAGSTVFTYETSQDSSDAISSAASRGLVTVTVDGTEVVAGDTLDSDGTVVQSAKSSVDNGSGSSGSDGSTVAILGGVLAAALVASFVVTFLLLQRVKPKRHILRGLSHRDFSVGLFDSTVKAEEVEKAKRSETGL